ncbi:MAG TPA: O-methyltransferase [Actinomycetota bacterium]|nr:O-methyltransferase [Actinomycetota bacterium]
MDRLAEELLGLDDPALGAALEASADAGLPSIQVSAAQGRFLHVVARALGARRILEIGTLGGYSTIWLARALPADGRLITLELDSSHAEVAQSNLERAGIADRVDVRIGPALDTLPTLTGEAPFDLVFIDADKPAYPDYLEWAIRLARPGTLIVADNVVRGGAVLDELVKDPIVTGTRRFLERLGGDPRIDATVVQTVGRKGYDGFAFAVVESPGGLAAR